MRRSPLYRKLDVHSRVELARVVVALGDVD
jgi:DNA-binding CsgD family transcriptional regulator